MEAAAGAGAGAAGGGEGVEAGGDERKENSTTLKKCKNLKECDPPPPPRPPTPPHVPSPLIQKRSSKKQDKQKLLHQDDNHLTWRGISQGAQNTPGDDDDDDDDVLADKRRTSSVVPSHHLHQHLQFTTDHRTSQDSSSSSQEQGACTHPSFGQEHVSPWIDCRDPPPTNPWDSGDVVVDTVDHCTPVKCVDDAAKKKMKKQAQEGVQKMGTTSDETWSSSCSSTVDCDDQQEVIKTQQQGSGHLLEMMGTEKIKHHHRHHHHDQKQPSSSSSSSETSCWRQDCRPTAEDELHQETYQDLLHDHHRPWQDPIPNCDTETLFHQQDDYDGMEKQQHVTAAVSLGTERSRLRGGREEDDSGIGLQENGPVWIVKAQRYPLRKRETREQQLLRRRGCGVSASMRNTSFLDDAEEHTISSFFRQPMKLQQKKKKKKKKRGPSPPAPKRKPRFCTGMNRGKGEDDDDNEQQQQLQQQRQRGASNNCKKKLSSVLPLLFLSTDETNGLWTRRSSCCKEEDCSGSHRRDCCHLRSCLDPSGPQSVLAAAHRHQGWDEGTGHKKAVVVSTPPQKCEEEQQGTAYYSSSKTPSMLSTARIIAKLEASSATKKAPFLSQHAQEDPRNPSSLFSPPASSPASSLLSLLSSSHHRRGLSGLRIGFCFGRQFEQRLLTQRKHGVYSRHKRKSKPRVARHMLQIRNNMVCILKH